MPSSTQQHSIWRMLSKSARGEFRTPSGKTALLLKTRCAITVVPAGPVPKICLHTAANWTHCELEDGFVRKVADELDYPQDAGPSFRTDFRDPAIATIPGLLVEELDQGGTSGSLYAASLAHALAVRVLLLDSSSKNAATSYRVASLPSVILGRIKERIEAELDGSLSLTALATESGYSQTHFLRMFHTATGLTPH